MKPLVALLALATLGAANQPGVRSEAFGTRTDGRAVQRHILVNARGMTVELMDHGAAIVRIAVPDGKGGAVDVVPAPVDLAGLLASNRRYGAIVGRYAGRLRGEVTIDGTRYPLATNASGVTLHGGDPGFDRAAWVPRSFATRDAVGLVFTHVSPDGDQGFPGKLTIEARYTLARDSDTLTLDITATADRPTVANLTNHVYFNLAGQGSVACHVLRVDADRRVELDARKLPTGRLVPVRGTASDFTRDRPLAPVLQAGGMDEMLVLSGSRTARLTDPASGRMLAVTTDQPGLQVFTGNAFDGADRDRAGRPIARHAAIALEPGHFADSPAIPAFPSTRVAPGKPLRWHAAWRFGRVAPAAAACTP
ncbi:galactose mutarotase [Sphingomonas sp. BT-65]|uniref:aldose epimerase family protein n=1 Tax=Sphingomonas sp. BT-65 TaxID=2989821 RepID=UPI002236A701|nr:aldose epimerase family protein [Sphingomonas sp. BT-65]MCW4463401.1 galactose mutarotase [Sphingomonas sp. BT-65]